MSDDDFVGKYTFTKAEWERHGETLLADRDYVYDDFVVRDDTEDGQGDAAATQCTTPLTDIDSSNIVTGTRKRRAPRTIYDEPDFQEQVASMMLADVPDAEMEAALTGETGICSSDSDGEGGEADEDDGEGSAFDQGEEEEDDDDFDIDAISVESDSAKEDPVSYTHLTLPTKA